MAKAIGAWVPDLNNPQHKAKTLGSIKSACGWAEACLNDKPREIAGSWIDKNLGDPNKNLGAYLRAKLLICTDDSWYFGEDGETKCKEYILNVEGLIELRAVLDLNQEPTPAKVDVKIDGSSTRSNVEYDYKNVLYWMNKFHKEELDTLDFKYEEKASARLWHNLQNMRSEAKNVVWPQVGLMYDYDIRACAPTLILQHAQQCDMDLYLETLEEFLQNTLEFRKHVADVAGWDYEIKEDRKKAKVLINALFCGARLGASKKYALFRLMDFDHKRMKAVQSDPKIKALRDDIKICWKYIEETMPVIKNDKGRKMPLSSGRKWQRYFELERAVLNSVRSYLSASGVKFFLEHDGFRSDQLIDVMSLSCRVLSSTGFSVEFVR